MLCTQVTTLYNPFHKFDRTNPTPPRLLSCPPPALPQVHAGGCGAAAGRPSHHRKQRNGNLLPELIPFWPVRGHFVGQGCFCMVTPHGVIIQSLLKPSALLENAGVGDLQAFIYQNFPFACKSCLVSQQRKICWYFPGKESTELRTPALRKAVIITRTGCLKHFQKMPQAGSLTSQLHG